MPEIVALLQSIAAVVSPTVLQQMSHVIYGLLISNGRITMLEISRWTERGGSYRTIQRWYHSRLIWLQIMWIWFTRELWKAGHEYIAAGDEVVFGKAGKETHGVGYFFSGLQQREADAAIAAMEKFFNPRGIAEINAKEPIKRSFVVVV